MARPNVMSILWLDPNVMSILWLETNVVSILWLDPREEVRFNKKMSQTIICFYARQESTVTAFDIMKHPHLSWTIMFVKVSFMSEAQNSCRT